MKRVAGLLLVSLASLANCSSADDGKRLRQLVGDGGLPAVQVHPRESVRISLIVNEGERPHYQHLEFLLGTDNSLRVRRYRGEPSFPPPYPKPIMEAEDQIGLPAATASEIRSRLAVFRPENLSTEGPFVMPKGCSFIFDNPSNLVIEFAVQDDIGGLFIVQEGCDHPNVIPLKDELRRILARLPQTKAAQRFDW